MPIRTSCVVGFVVCLAGSLLGCAEDPGVDAGRDASIPTPDAMPHTVLINLEPGAYLHGEQKTLVRSTSPHGALRVDLFLDTERIGGAEVAPFEILWSTSKFHEGEHELRARTYLGNNTSADAVVTIRIDNTPPMFHGLPSRIERGAIVQLPVSDNMGVARVQVGSKTIAKAPFELAWDASCGESSILIQVIDVAGLEWSSQVQVETIYPDDGDCDAFRAVAFGGDDCNDADRRVHPQASDYGNTEVDVNCDGMPGVDGDHDGVATRETGGDDCNDALSSVHGAQIRWRKLALTTMGLSRLPVQSELLRGAAGGADIHIVTWWSGTLDHIAMKLDGSSAVRRNVAGAGAGPATLFHRDGELIMAYATDAKLRVGRWSGEAWSSEDAADLSTSVRAIRIAAVGNRLDAVYVTDTNDLYLARRTNGSWTTRHLGQVDAARIAAFNASEMRFLAWGRNNLYRVRYHASNPIIDWFFPSSSRNTYAGAMFQGTELIYAIYNSWRTTIHREGGVEIGEVPYSWMHAITLPYYGEVWIGDNSRYVIRPRTTGSGGKVAGLNLSSFYSATRVGASAGNDAVLEADECIYVIDSTITPASDRLGDGVDANCDGVDG